MNAGQRTEIGQRIRYERKYRGLTLDEGSKIIGVTSSYLGLVERGERCLSLDNMVKFCSVFGVSIDYILYGSSSFRETPESLKDDIIFYLEGMTEKDYNIILGLIKSYSISSKENFPYKLRIKNDNSNK